MEISGKDSKKSNRFRGVKPETVEKYRRAIEMYASTELSGCEICRICEVTESGFRCYLTKYHRELVLARYAILCSKEEAGTSSWDSSGDSCPLPVSNTRTPSRLAEAWNTSSATSRRLRVNSGWKTRTWAGSCARTIPRL